MLVLTRKTDQGIVIEGGVTIRVLGVDGDRVKLGITAPEHRGIWREELEPEWHAVLDYDGVWAKSVGEELLEK